MRHIQPRVPLGRFSRASCTAALSVCTCSAAAARAQEPASTGSPDETELSLEAPMQIEVTSASRKSQALADVPAAIFVLTHDDLRRSGASSLPEVLRLLPGMDVARLDSNRWAVSSRGFNNEFANKMLVPVDGRSVYTPLFSDLCWDEVDVPFELIERIEVMRGPGAAMWGSNAVTGVTSIITRDSPQTHGAQSSASAGLLELAMLAQPARRQGE